MRQTARRPGAQAWEYAWRLAFPRLSGSCGEKTAADLIETTLASFGYVVERHTFPVRETPWAWMKRALVCGIALLLLAGWVAGKSPLLATLLCVLLFGLPPLMNRLWAWRILNHDDDAQSPCATNLIAPHPNSAPNGLTVYLLAHYDSKSQTLPIVWRMVFIITVLVGTLTLGVSQLAVALWPDIGVWPFAPAIARGVTVFWAVALLATLALLWMGTENRSPGGLDNAGSVGALLLLAEVLRDHVWEHVKVVFVATGAEELGLVGSTFLARRLCTSEDKPTLWVLNLDGLGVPRSLRMVEGTAFLHPPRTRFAQLLQQVSNQLSIPLRPLPMLPGFLLDHIPFSRAGFAATSLVTLSKNGRHIHTPNDTIAQVEPAGLEEAVTLVLATLAELDRTG